MSNSPFGKEYKPSLDLLISLAKAADDSGLTAGYLRRLLRNRHLWGMKIGGNWVTTKAAVDFHIAKNLKPGRKPKS